MGGRGTEIKEEHWRGDGWTRGRAQRKRKNEKIAAGCNRGPRLLSVSFVVPQITRKEGKKEGGTEGRREGWIDSSPSSDDACLHHHLAIAASSKYGPSTNKAKKKKNSITYF